MSKKRQSRHKPKRKTKKRRSIGKLKGGKFERKICRDLSRWITNGQRHDCFWRSAMSGGRATMFGRDVRQSGDITAVSEEGLPFTDRWFAECKHVRDLRIDCFCVQHKGDMWRFWKIAKEQAENHGKRPMLIAAQNRMPTLLIVAKCDLPPENAPVMCIVGNRKTAACIMLFDDVMKLPAAPWLPQRNGNWIRAQVRSRELTE